MLISSWLRTVQSRLRYGRRMRLRRTDVNLRDRQTATEQLEERALLTPLLVAVQPNEGVFWELNGDNSMDVAPDELTLQFSAGENIDISTLQNGGLEILASGNDGTFGDGNETVIRPGYIGMGVSPEEVLLRFSQTLQDDFYQVTAFGTGANPIQNIDGESLNDGDADTIVNFQLDLGAKITAVVPQPITKDPTTGAASQALDQIVVYFNDDDLDPVTAEDPRFYKLIYTSESISSLDDVANQFSPTSVVYDAAADTATLTFSASIDQLNGVGGGSYRLRIGTDEGIPAAPVLTTVGDAGSSFDTANTIVGDLAVNTSQILSGGIDAQPYNIQFPGANNEPGHREIEPESHLLGGPDGGNGVTVITYNFETNYGFDPQGNPLTNIITTEQKERAREIFEFYSEQTGLDFQETGDNQPVNFTIVTGDLRALDPNISTGPGGVAGLAGGGIAIMDAAENWNNEPGGSWFDVAMHEIGHLLGLGHTYELAPETIQGAEGAAGNGLSEPQYPGHHDLTHLRHLWRPDGIDIDMYQFTVSSAGTFSAETIAERGTTASHLDSLLRLYQVQPDGSHALIAQNDDYFSEDSFIEVDLEPGEYFVGVSSTGNDDYDPTIVNTGINGTSEGAYDLRLDFRPSANDSILDVDDTSGDDAPSAFDGDSDGLEGGVYNFWFNAFPQSDVIFVDRTAPTGGVGTIASPFNEIDVALATATARQQANQAAALPDLRQIVRIIGNAGADGLLETPEDAVSYEIGIDTNNIALRDGANIEVPKGVTVMVDAGVVMKFRRSRIGVGSTLATVDRSASALQILGTPYYDVTMTSWNNEDIGGDTTANLTSPISGDWGGIAFQNDVDYRSTNFNYQREGIFLNYVNHANMTYGGGTVAVDSALQIINPIHMTRSRPELSYNTITLSADSALSADPNSFEETKFTTPEFQRGSSFSLGYDRVGPVIHDNILVANSTNGLFVRVNTPAGDVRRELTVPGRFDDRDVTHVIAETLQVSGTPGGPFRQTEAPPMDVTFVTDSGSGSLVGSFNYRLVYVTDNGFEGPASVVTNTVTPTNGGLTLNGLPAAEFPFAGRRLYRSDATGGGTYSLIAQLDAAGAVYVDNGTTLVGELQPQASVLLARTDARLAIDPGIIVKMRGASIEVENSAQLIAEGQDGQEIIFTSLLDDRFGRGGTFDTNNDDAMEAAPAPGDWGGLYAGNLSSLSLDYAYVGFAGGVTPVQGNFAGFNAVELHQATGRITNSEFELNADGTGGGAPASRFGLGANSPGTVFIRNSQPIFVGNVIRDNLSGGLSINVNALTHELNRDVGRSTGPADLITAYGENFGPLIRDNIVDRNAINGIEVRAETLTAESVWDDADIVHVVRNEIYIPDFHTYGGLRLQSTPDSSLVVKFDGPNAGLTANGRPLDISDRIGGMLHVVGQPGNPVVLTALADDSKGAGFGLDGLPHADTNNDGIDQNNDGLDDSTGAPVSPAVPAPGRWRGLLIDEFASDRNVGIYVENETNRADGGETNNGVIDAEPLGALATTESNSDENLRIGFEVHGNVKQPGDLDVYSFAATAGTEVWVDIDFSRHAFDPVVELLDPNGNIVAISDNSIDESAGVAFLVADANVNPMERSPLISFDNYTTNQRDAGFRVILPGNPGFAQQYFVRVRSSSSDSAANQSNLTDLTKEGLTSGSYQLQVRINEIDEQPGTTIRYADIRYATDGIEVKGQPTHSPLTGEFAETVDIGDTPNSADLGNVLNSDRAVLSVSGRISSPDDVDMFTFEVAYDSTQQIADVTNQNQQVPVVIDLDYADGISRANTVLSIFDDNGSFVWMGRDSNITDDQGGPLQGADIDDLSRGSAGVLDPYIGPIELPVGTYHLAVSSNDQLPAALDQFTVANAADPTIRLEPNDAIVRIAEEHFDNIRTTAQAPITDLFTDVDAQAVPWHLGDTTLYISTDTGRTGGNFQAIQQVNPFTGLTIAKLGEVNPAIADIAMRPDGELYTYTVGPNAGAASDANSGNYLRIDVENGAVTNIGDDGIQTFHGIVQGNNVVSTATNVGFQFEAMVYTGTGANDGFAVGNRTNTPPAAVQGPTRLSNVMYQFNIVTGGAISTTAQRTGNTRHFLAGTQIVEVGELNVTGTVTGMAQLANGSMWAITDAGLLYRINRNAQVLSAGMNVGGGAFNFEGLAAGPDDVENGRYANTLFGITNGGTLMAFDTTGTLLPIFNNAATSLNTGMNRVTGLDFSTLDRNLWHTSTNRRTENAIYEAPDDSRRQFNGGTSLYFGNDVAAADAGNRNNLSTTVSNTVNFPGGAHGGIVSNDFSLEGYSPADNPVLYFNYYIDTEDTLFNPDSDPVNLMRDSFRAYVGSDTTLNGNTSWSLVSTNSQYQDSLDPDEYDLAPDGTYSTTYPSAQTYPDVQPILETAPGSRTWRQVRIDLSSFAGQEDLRLRFEFSTAGSVGVGTAHVGEELRALPGEDLHDGQRFIVDGRSFEFDMGYSLITPSAPAVTEGETFTINGVAFEMDTDGTTAGGAVAIAINANMTAAQVAQRISTTLGVNGISNVIEDNRVNITESPVVLVQSGGNSITREGQPGVVGGRVPVVINATSSRAFVASQMQQALADVFANGETDVIKTGGDLVRIIGHTVNSPGPLPFTSELPGDSDFASFTNPQRTQNNAIEGVYIDNIIIGFAERGEMVVNAAPNTGFTQHQEINNPNVPATNLYQDILVGPYDVEIRRATTFGHGETQPAFPFLGLTKSYDTNTRFVDRLTLIAPEAKDIADGQTFTLSDGDTVLTFEFEDVQLNNGVASGNVRVPFNPQAFETGGQGQASSFVVARAIRDAINSPAAQGAFDIAASTGDGQDTETTGTSNQVAIAGVAIFEPGNTNVTFTRVDSVDAFGDDNVHREQGQILIESNTVTDSLNYGINVGPGDRTPGNAAGAGTLSHQGPVRNLQNLNSAREVPGVVIMNNVVAYNGTGGIRFAGDPGADAPAPYGRIVNNTVYGSLDQDAAGNAVVGSGSGIGIDVQSGASPTLLNNIVAAFATGISVNGADAVIGGTVFKDNSTDSNAGLGQFAITIADGGPQGGALFVDEFDRNFYLSPTSLAIDSSLDTLADRPSIVNVKSPLGIAPSPILSPRLDVFGQLRGDDPDVSPPAGLGANVFKDRGAIDRVDFEGPFAMLATPEDEGLDDLLMNVFNVVWNDDETQLRAFVLQLTDAGIGVDDRQISTDQFELFQDGVLLVEDVDYQFIYNSVTDEVIFRSITQFDTDARYELNVDNDDDVDDGLRGVRDLAGNYLEPNQADGSTRFGILLTDTVNDPPIHDVPDTSVDAIEVNEDTPLVFDVATMFNGESILLTVDDADANVGDINEFLLDPSNVFNLGPGTLTMTLTATNGLLSLADPSLVDFTTGVGDGTDDLTMTFDGTLAELNAAIDGLTFQGDFDYFGPASITITTNDNGNFTAPDRATGLPQPAEQDVDVILIDVLPINDAPRFTLGGDVTRDEDEGLVTIPNYASISAVESFDTITDIDVSWSLVQPSQFDPATFFIVEPAIDVSGTLTFQTADDRNGVVDITVVISDDGVPSPPPNSAVSDPQFFTINVTAINDAPLFDLPGQAPDSLEDAGPQTVPGFATNMAVGPATALDEINDQTLVGFTTSILTIIEGDITFISGPDIDVVTGDLTYEVAPDTAGTAQITVILEDDGTAGPAPDSNVTSRAFNIVVQDVNDAPRFDLPADAPVVNEDAGPQTIAGFASNITAGTNNEDNNLNQTVTFVATVVSTTGTLTFSDGPDINWPSGDLTYTPTADTNGTAIVDVIAIDSGSGDNTSVIMSFMITVNAINDAPTATVPVTAPASFEDSGRRVVSGFVSDIIPGPIDEIDQILTYANVTVTVTSGNLTFSEQPTIDPITGDLTYRADADTWGTVDVSFNLVDDGAMAAPHMNTSALYTFEITVTQVTNPATLSGRKFNDLNANAVLDPGEPFLQGWEFEIYNDLGFLITTVTSGADGRYTWDQASPITHTISEIEQADWAQSYPTNKDPHTVTPALGQVLDTLDFGNFVPARVEGRKFHDNNANGVFDPADDAWLNGWTIALLDSAGQPVLDDAGDPITTITADFDSDGDGVVEPGWYSIEDIIPGDYIIREVQQPTWGSSLPVSGEYVESLTSDEEFSAYFGNYIYASVEGNKFHDRNGTGALETGEEYLNGWTIELVDSVTSMVVASTVTADFDKDGDGSFVGNEVGFYRFENVVPGDYVIREILPAGWGASTPTDGSMAVTIVSDEDVVLDFGNYEFSTITGRKFLDLSVDGVRQPSEAWLDGWVIDLVDSNGVVVATDTTHGVDSNGNGTIDDVELGWYVFDSVAPGSYSVVERLTADWKQTAPAAGFWSVAVASGDLHQNRDFGNFAPGEITGRKLLDENANGQADTSEPYLDGWVIELWDSTGSNLLQTTQTRSLDLDNDGTVGADETGIYLFDDLNPGDYVVRESLPAGWIQSVPGGSFEYEVSVGNFGRISDIDFGNYQTSTVQGRKFHDENGNGVWDANEVPLNGFRIELVNGNNIISTVTSSVDTDGDGVPDTDGWYSFEGLRPGVYTVREPAQGGGWVQSSPVNDGVYSLTLTSGSMIVDQDFGNFQPATVQGTQVRRLECEWSA